MSDLIQLTEAEIDAVAGGVEQVITIGTLSATQSAASTLTQTVSASNTGAVTATASGAGSVAAAAGAEASAYASVSQRNSIEVG